MLSKKNTSLDFIVENAPYSGIFGGRTTQNYTHLTEAPKVKSQLIETPKVKSMFADEPLDTRDQIMKFLTRNNQPMIRDINSGKFMEDIKNITQKYKGGKKTKNKRLRKKRKTRRNKI